MFEVVRHNIATGPETRSQHSLSEITLSADRLKCKQCETRRTTLQTQHSVVLTNQSART